MLDYYHMLPGHSLTQEAILNDPEAVEAMAEEGLFDKKSGEKKIRVSENTPLLDAIYDLLVELRISNHIAKGGKGRVQNPPKLDVPVVEEVRAKVQRAEYEALKSFFSGG